MSYKLTYFNGTGLAESLRFLMHYGGIKFEDKRMEFSEWPEIKPTTPIGKVPVLEIDGKQYHQSRAIGRFLAKKTNLYGSDDIEAMEIDATVDTIEDMRIDLSQYFWEKDATFKARFKESSFQKRAELQDKLEQQVKKNGGYFVRGKLSWADILYASFMDYLSLIAEEDFNKNHPELKKLVEKVRAIPSIKAYLDKRPKTDF